MEEINFKQKLQEIEEWLVNAYSSIRSGQATPALLDAIRVQSYGTLVPLNQIANTAVEDARTLRINPWDTANISAIETALTEADLGVSVATDSEGVRAIFPELTSERRTQLSKLAKQKLEEARIRVRGLRDEVMKLLDQKCRTGELSEDETYTQKETVQTSVTAANTKLEEFYQKKEQELQT